MLRILAVVMVVGGLYGCGYHIYYLIPGIIDLKLGVIFVHILFGVLSLICVVVGGEHLKIGD